MEGKEAPKIGGTAYVSGIAWGISLLLMAWVMPAFGKMFAELGYGGHRPLPFTVRLLLDAPRVVWIVLGLLVGGGLIWKSKLLHAKTAGRIDTISVIPFGVFAAFVVFSMWRPLVSLSSDGSVWPTWLPF